MRILHTSDWHLGRQFHHLSLLEDQRHILEQLVNIAAEQKVDVILIAGDIYDRAIPPAAAVKLLDDVLKRLNHDLGIPIIIISGNHDSGQRLAFGAQQLAKAGIHMCGVLDKTPEPIILNDAYGEVAFYGLPYADPAMVRDVLEVEVHSFDQATEVLCQQILKHNSLQRRSVVLSHCFLDGGEISESERPLSVGGADQVAANHFNDFNYVALGHLHAPQYRLKPSIRYSGSLLKYSFSEEKQQKSVTLVDMDGVGECKVEQIPLIAKRDMRILEGHLDEILENAQHDPNNEDYLLIRLLDKHAILDVMGKLRQAYPNVLHIERPSLMQGGERQQSSREHLTRGEMPLFKDFYQQMTGDEMDAESAELVAKLIDTIHQEDV